MHLSVSCPIYIYRSKVTKLSGMMTMLSSGPPRITHMMSSSVVGLLEKYQVFISLIHRKRTNPNEEWLGFKTSTQESHWSFNKIQHLSAPRLSHFWLSVSSSFPWTFTAARLLGALAAGVRSFQCLGTPISKAQWFQWVPSSIVDIKLCYR